MGRAFHVAFATQAQEAFLEGHVLAFEHFGVVPGRVRAQMDHYGALPCQSARIQADRRQVLEAAHRLCVVTD